jgi:hypothetical protein
MQGEILGGNIQRTISETVQFIIRRIFGKEGILSTTWKEKAQLNPIQFKIDPKKEIIKDKYSCAIM